jgi:AcrR family transcriptional regulator
MEVARDAFAECGCELPMEELARRAEVGVGTLYRHFPNKEALLDALLADQLALLVERTCAALDKDDSWEAFRDLVRDGAAMQAENIAFCESIMARKDISKLDAVAELRAQLEGKTSTLIERAQATGRMRADFTVADVPLLFASIGAAIRLLDGDPSWRRQVEFALDGLRAQD